MTDTIPGPEPDTPPWPPRHVPWRDRLRGFAWPSRAGVAAAVALLAVGAAGGVACAGLLRPEPETFQPGLAASSIANAADGGWIALDGEVAEIFGNKFVIADGAARALVDTGPAGEDQGLVAPGERVTVQGRFDHGFLHAGAIRRADGAIENLAPPPHPPHPPRGI